MFHHRLDKAIEEPAGMENLPGGVLSLETKTAAAAEIDFDRKVRVSMNLQCFNVWKAC